MATAIRDRSSTYLKDVKAWLEIPEEDTSYDGLLAPLLEAVKARADEHCDNDFVDANGAEADIPSSVELWIKTTVARFFSFRENGVTQEQLASVGSAALGPLDYSGLNPSWGVYL